MSDRLILKPQPVHHRQRFYTLVGLGLVLIFGVWGLQLKLTFAKSAAAREANSQLGVAASQLQQATDLEVPVDADSLAQLKDLLSQTFAQKAIEVEVLDQAVESMKVEIAEQQPAPVVAGEHIETE